jgi:heme exporter protein A
VTLLALTDVACVRGGRLLFERMNLTLEAGGAAVVTGPNGVGKSSLIRVAAGLLRAVAGTVRREGAIALADEGAALDERVTLAQALGFWARIDGVRPEPGMEAMGLLPLARVPVRMLSTGQRRRAVLARIVASGARLWLLDEPANGVDAEGQERLTEAMRKHRQGGGAILAASHQPLGLEDAQQVAL